ncbi:MAG TPA: ROK family protein [Candidatus Dormibacteraeota bacterium]|nr:ROK family protein [Candidatus Dormibacteraeota bacterium]
MIGRDELGQRSETVRRANLRAIVRELHERGPLVRSALVARTGLTRSAIRGLVGELSEAGLVSEEASSSFGAPGRPSPLVRLDPCSATVLAMEIAVDSMAAAVVGLGGTIHGSVRVDRPRRHTSVDEIVGDLAGLVRAVRSRRPADEPLVGAGVAVVGVVRRSDGLVSMAPNLGWRDAPLGERLDAALGLPVAVAVANEADLGALAEHRRGAAVGVDDVLFLSGEVGVGGGSIIGGAPLTGAAGYAGEVGHMAVRPAEGRTCRCGSTGCWETEVGGGAVLRRAGRPEDGGRAEVDAVIEAAAFGDATALAALDETGWWLGVGLASLIDVLGPRLIVLGGLFARIHPFVSARVEEVLDRRTLPAPRALVRVVPAALGVDAPLLGAAELAFEPLLSDPAAWFAPRQAAELATA